MTSDDFVRVQRSRNSHLESAGMFKISLILPLQKSVFNFERRSLHRREENKPSYLAHFNFFKISLPTASWCICQILHKGVPITLLPRPPGYVSGRHLALLTSANPRTPGPLSSLICRLPGLWPGVLPDRPGNACACFLSCDLSKSGLQCRKSITHFPCSVRSVSSYLVECQGKGQND